MKKGIFYGVGVGPGDAGLITVKAANIIQNSLVLAVPYSGPERKSTALEIIRPYLNPQAKQLEILFPMTKDRAVLRKSWQEGAGKIESYLQKGADVTLITLGDPTLYSTCGYIHQLLAKAGYVCELIPGVPSFCAAAARAGFPLVEEQEALRVFPYDGNDKRLEEALETDSNLVIMKSGKKLARVLDFLKRKHLLAHCVVVSNCGLPGETVCNGEEIKQPDALGYFTTVIVKKPAPEIGE